MNITAKQVVKRAIRWFGWDLHRYLPSGSDASRLRAILKANDINVVFDVGANCGQYAEWLREIGYTNEIISFEPQPDAHRALVKRASGDQPGALRPAAQ